jgi:hypothetical protein
MGVLLVAVGSLWPRVGRLRALMTSGRILISLCIQFVSFAIADLIYVESTLVQFHWTGLGDAVEQG